MQFSYNVLNLPETVTKSDGSCSLTYTYLSDGTKVRARIDREFGSGLLGIDLAKIDFGARFYDPYTARWTTIDPLAYKYPDVSPYTYCANDPINYLDIDGFDVRRIDEKGHLIGQPIIDMDDDVLQIVEKENSGKWINKENASVVFKKGTIQQITDSKFLSFQISNDLNAKNAFETMANNTSVE